MIHLSRDTVALAHRLATLRGISLEDAVTLAIEHSAREAGLASQPLRQRDLSPGAVAARKARLDEIADAITKMPVLDPRTTRAIMDDINRL